MQAILPKSFAGRIGFLTAVVIGIGLIIGIATYSYLQAQWRAKAQAEQISSQFEDYLDKVRLIIEDISKRRQQSIVNPALREFGPGLIWDIAHSREAYVDAVALYEGNQLKGNTEDTDAWVDKGDLQSKDEKPRMELQVIQYPGVSGFVKPALYVAYPIDNPQKEEQPWKIFLRIGIPRDVIIAPNIPANSIFLLAPDDRIIVANEPYLISSKYSFSLRYFIKSKRRIQVEDRVLGNIVVRADIWLHLIISLVIAVVIGFSIFKAIEWQIEPPIRRLITGIEHFSPIDVNGLKWELKDIADAFNRIREELQSTMEELQSTMPLAGYGVAQIHGEHHGITNMPIRHKLTIKRHIITRLSEDIQFIERKSERIDMVVKEAIHRSFYNKWADQYRKSPCFETTVEDTIDSAFSKGTATIENVLVIGGKNINISLTVQCKSEQPVKSPYLLQAVLESMIDNALKALLPRDAKGPAEPSLKVVLTQSNAQEIVIKVCDNGQPIINWIEELLSKDMIEFTKKIKDELDKLSGMDDEEAEREYPNIPAGIGLFLSKKILDDIYNGELRISNEPKKEVSITIPISQLNP